MFSFDPHCLRKSVIAMNGHLLIMFGIWCLCLGQVVIQMDTMKYHLDEINLMSLEKPYCGHLDVQLSDHEKDEILMAHYYARRRENATDMLLMIWDEGLARHAQAKANTCRYVHSMLTDCQGLDLGQNLFANWGYSPDYPPINYTKVTYFWANERDYWNYTTNECQTGQKCGHWKILTGAASWRLGCGKAKCPTLEVQDVLRNQSNFVVCDYGPYHWGFQRGTPRCSGCHMHKLGLGENGYTCDTGLCVPCSSSRNTPCKNLFNTSAYSGDALLPSQLRRT